MTRLAGIAQTDLDNEPSKPFAEKSEASAKNALRALIGALESATEGSRELDIKIHDLLWLNDVTGTWHEPRDYTRSLDAALTLLPGVWWRVGKVQDKHSPMRSFGHGKIHVAEVGLNWGDAPKRGHSDSAPVAL